MVCKKCGELLNDGARVCPVCGAKQRASGEAKLNPTHVDYDDCAHEERRSKKRSSSHPGPLADLLFLVGVLVLIVGLPVIGSRVFSGQSSPLLLIPLLLIAILLGVFRNKWK